MGLGRSEADKTCDRKQGSGDLGFGKGVALGLQSGFGRLGVGFGIGKSWGCVSR